MDKCPLPKRNGDQTRDKAHLVNQLWDDTSCGARVRTWRHRTWILASGKPAIDTTQSFRQLVEPNPARRSGRMHREKSAKAESNWCGSSVAGGRALS
jgi:hypothetical protein